MTAQATYRQFFIVFMLLLTSGLSSGGCGSGSDEADSSDTLVLADSGGTPDQLISVDSPGPDTQSTDLGVDGSASVDTTADSVTQADITIADALIAKDVTDDLQVPSDQTPPQDTLPDQQGSTDGSDANSVDQSSADLVGSDQSIGDAESDAAEVSPPSLSVSAGDDQIAFRGASVSLHAAYSGNVGSVTCSWQNEDTKETHQGCDWSVTAGFSATFTVSVKEIFNGTAYSATDSVQVTVNDACSNQTQDNGETGTDCGNRTLWFNEVHYDNTGDDQDEGFEIAGPASFKLDGWRVNHYNGAGVLQVTNYLAGNLSAGADGVGLKWFSVPKDQLVNGDMALMLADPEGRVVQFIGFGLNAIGVTYEGQSLQATLVGAHQSDQTPVGQSLQLTGDGNDGTGSWTVAARTPGQVNSGQRFYPLCASCADDHGCTSAVDCGSGSFCWAPNGTGSCAPCSVDAVDFGPYIGDGTCGGGGIKSANYGQLTVRRVSLANGNEVSPSFCKHKNTGHCSLTDTVACNNNSDCPNGEVCHSDGYAANTDVVAYSLDVVFPYGVTWIGFELRRGLNWGGLVSVQYKLIGLFGQVTQTGVLALDSGETALPYKFEDMIKPVKRMVLFADITNVKIGSKSKCENDANVQCMQDSDCTSVGGACLKDNYSFAIDNITYTGPLCL